MTDLSECDKRCSQSSYMVWACAKVHILPLLDITLLVNAIDTFGFLARHRSSGPSTFGMLVHYGHSVLFTWLDTRVR